MAFSVKLQQCLLLVAKTSVVENGCSKLYGCEGHMINKEAAACLESSFMNKSISIYSDTVHLK